MTKCLGFKLMMTIRRLRPTCLGFESTKSLNRRFQRRRDVWSVWVVAP
ncbi:unnamed protein product, partial [Brassica rapa subsp. trilocularis]